MLHFREVIESDLERLLVIENLGFSEEEAATKNAFIERIRMIADSFIVAEKDGLVIGYVNGPVMNDLYITDDLFSEVKHNPRFGGVQSILGLAVHPAYREQGIGQQLLQHLQIKAVQSERTAISLTCKKHLISYYERFGYENHGVAASTHGGVEWFNMIKKL